MKTPEGKC